MSKSEQKNAEGEQDPLEDPIVDRSLLEETLRMTLVERLALNDRMARTIVDLHNGFEET